MADGHTLSLKPIGYPRECNIENKRHDRGRSVRGRRRPEEDDSLNREHANAENQHPVTSYTLQETLEVGCAGGISEGIVFRVSYRSILSVGHDRGIENNLLTAVRLVLERQIARVNREKHLHFGSGGFAVQKLRGETDAHSCRVKR